MVYIRRRGSVADENITLHSNTNDDRKARNPWDLYSTQVSDIGGAATSHVHESSKTKTVLIILMRRIETR